MPLSSSLWVDEMGTYFVVHHGAADPTLQAAPQVPASIYYVLPKFAEEVAGFSEISYRFFSVIAMLGSLAALAWIAGRVIHPNTGWFVVFAAMTSRGFNYQADDARPYALGTLVFTVSVFLLIRWLDSGRMRDGLFFVAAASLLWWVHMVFWPFYLIFAIYTVFRISRSETPTSLGSGDRSLCHHDVRSPAGGFPRGLSSASGIHTRRSSRAPSKGVAADPQTQSSDLEHWRELFC